MSWHYRIYTPGETTRDPIGGEFFSTDAITNPAEALVREGIQNALDAGKNRGMVGVRIFLATGESSLSAAQSAKWFDGAWEHFQAPGNGLWEQPTQNDKCAFLAFEDFGTTGLQGDITQAFDEPGIKNSFFYFFRAEGRSSKGEQDLGRWGIGKQVFPRSSRINTVYGLTVRLDDNKQFLMGHTVLKSHILNGDHFSPDGHYGEKQSNKLVLPIADKTTLDDFRADFNLRRKSEPGLSVVVPFVEAEITIDNLKQAVVEGYFYPILKGKLTVRLEIPGTSILIDAETLMDVVKNIGDNDLSQTVEFAKWAASCKESEIFSLNPCDPGRAPTWSENLVPLDLIKEIQDKLVMGEKIALKATLTVKEKRQTSQVSNFHFFLWQDSYEGGKPVFIREGIIISDVRAKIARGIRSLVIVDDKPLAKLLGDSENPAHTQWQKESSNFKGKYTNGGSYIAFVTQAVSYIVNLLSTQDKEEDKDLLLDIFSLPPEKLDEGAKKSVDKPQLDPGIEVDKPDIDDVEPHKKRFRLQRVQGGFTITEGEQGAKTPAQLDIKCAYDLRSGNPIKQYESAAKAGIYDFRIEHDGVKITQQVGVNIIERLNNHIRLQIVASEFRFTVRGFDENRDLFVNVRMVEGADD